MGVGVLKGENGVSRGGVSKGMRCLGGGVEERATSMSERAIVVRYSLRIRDFCGIKRRPSPTADGS
jgi:hypothetical protein